MIHYQELNYLTKIYHKTNMHSATKYTIHIIIELYNEIKAEAVVIY